MYMYVYLMDDKKEYRQWTLYCLVGWCLLCSLRFCDPSYWGVWRWRWRNSFPRNTNTLSPVDCPRDRDTSMKSTCLEPSECSSIGYGWMIEGTWITISLSRLRTKETLVSGNYMSVINVLMQLRKVSVSIIELHTCTCIWHYYFSSEEK